MRTVKHIFLETRTLYNMDVQEKFRSSLKLLIEASGKSKTQIANEIGMSKSVVSDYLSGRLLPSIFTLIKICKALDCTYEDILGPV